VLLARLTSGDISLVRYDTTTLSLEAADQDDLPRVGYSKERRVDPQIVVGLLVDRQGFPLEVGCLEGNRAETTTIVPLVKAFADRHGPRAAVRLRRPLPGSSAHRAAR
jgi:hypothetical protein